MIIEKFADNLWVVNGNCVKFLGMPYSTRMTVVRLSCGGLWVHSPIEWSLSLHKELALLGEIKYLIAPNSLHHLFLPQWIIQYPQAKLYGTDEVIKKRTDLSFTGSLNTEQSWDWQDDIEQLIFVGSPLMQECVFFHKSSQTLVVTDLVENFSGKDFNHWQKIIAKIVGILAPNGKMPLDWRLSFIFQKPQARKCLEKILQWQPQQLIMSHGEIVTDDTTDFLMKSFKWLK